MPLGAGEPCRAASSGYVRMNIPERRDAVAELTDEGLSTREIGDMLGVGIRLSNGMPLAQMCHPSARTLRQKWTPEPASTDVPLDLNDEPAWPQHGRPLLLRHRRVGNATRPLRPLGPRVRLRPGVVVTISLPLALSP